MNSREVRAVVFDFDGVIVDSAAAVEDQWNEFALRYGLDAQELLAGVHGRRDADVIARWLPASRRHEAMEWMRSRDFDHRELPLVPGAADALAAVSGSGRWAIASSATRPALEAWLQAKAVPAPTALVSASDVTHGKPDPECYRLAAAGLGIAPTDCVVLEDAPLGIEAANRAGIGCVIGIGTTHSADALEAATLVVPDLAHLRFEVGAEHITIAW